MKLYCRLDVCSAVLIYQQLVLFRLLLFEFVFIAKRFDLLVDMDNLAGRVFCRSYFHKVQISFTGCLVFYTLKEHGRFS